MAPARNLLRRHHDNFASFFDQAGLDQLYERSILMAEKAAESSARNAQEEEEEEEKEEEVAEASSKLHASGSYQSWLQLGTGTSQIAMAPQDPAASTTRGRGGVVELDLFPGRPPVDPLQPRLPPQPMMVLGGYGGQLRGFWRSPSPSSSSSAVAPLHPVMPSCSGQFMQTQATTSSSDIRVVSPPPRPQTGLWVMLKPAENQIKEPFLTEIPKSYLRIKDARMTSRLLMRYLANKLGLDDESEEKRHVKKNCPTMVNKARKRSSASTSTSYSSEASSFHDHEATSKVCLMDVNDEVQISCRGQQIPPVMTLQQIRDQIWCSTETTALPPESSTADHLMTLYYSRS